MYDVAPEPLAELGAGRGRASPATSASWPANVDLVCVMVRDDDQVREVLDGVVGVVRPDGARR